MLCGLGMVHSHFIASSGSSGVYTTVETDESIALPLQCNSIKIFAQGTDLAIKFNNDEAIMYIPHGTSDGILAMPINRIIVVGAAGQEIKWTGLTSINNT